MNGHIDQFFVGAPFRARCWLSPKPVAPGRALLRGRALTEHGRWILPDLAGRAVSSPPLLINRKLPDGGLGTARPTMGNPPQLERCSSLSGTVRLACPLDGRSGSNEISQTGSPIDESKRRGRDRRDACPTTVAARDRYDFNCIVRLRATARIHPHERD